jgi:hypothetical protein
LKNQQKQNLPGRSKWARSSGMILMSTIIRATKFTMLTKLQRFLMSPIIRDAIDEPDVSSERVCNTRSRLSWCMLIMCEYHVCVSLSASNVKRPCKDRPVIHVAQTAIRHVRPILFNLLLQYGCRSRSCLQHGCSMACKSLLENDIIQQHEYAIGKIPFLI